MPHPRLFFEKMAQPSYEAWLADPLGIALQQLLDPLIEVAKKDIEDGRIRSLDDIKRMFGPGGGQR